MNTMINDSDEVQGESYRGHTVRGDAGMSFDEYCAWLRARSDVDVAVHIERDSEPTVSRGATTVRVVA